MTNPTIQERRADDLLYALMLLADDDEQANVNDSPEERLRQIKLLISNAWDMVDSEDEADEAYVLLKTLIRESGGAGSGS